jgi:hypothetical protein
LLKPVKNLIYDLGVGPIKKVTCPAFQKTTHLLIKSWLDKITPPSCMNKSWFQTLPMLIPKACYHAYANLMFWFIVIYIFLHFYYILVCVLRLLSKFNPWSIRTLILFCYIFYILIIIYLYNLTLWNTCSF